LRGFAGNSKYVLTVAAGLLAASVCVRAGDLSLNSTGDVLGSVMDSGQVPQMGATVQLFNKFERLVAKAITGMDGRFAFAGLNPDVYSIRVSGPSFLPVSRDRIAVKAGMDSLLQIHLASLLSSIDVSYRLPTAGMSNDWKWVLRSSPATRPITRFLGAQVSVSRPAELFPHIFSGTHAMVTISGGDTSLVDTESGQADLGTGFVLSTNILGKNQVQLGGNYAQSTPMGPSAMGLVAIYSRNGDGGSTDAPEVTLTVSQLGLVMGPGASSAGSTSSSVPSMRDMSLSIYQTTDPIDNVHLEYGMTAESVDFLQHSSRISPFARMTVLTGDSGKFIVSYSDGGRPDELFAHQVGNGFVERDTRGDDLAMAAGIMTRLPQVSYGDRHLELQRTQSYEAGFQETFGSRTLAVSGFYENVSNGRANVSGNTSVLNPDDLLSDGVSKTLVYDIGRYRRTGFVASADQRVNDFFGLTLSVGRMGGFTANSQGLWDGTQGGFLEERKHNVANVTVNAKLPRSGTRILTNYGWMGQNSLIPTHVFTTQSAYVSPGLNVLIRQPLPCPFGMPGHFEVTADLRNLLAQGYLPVGSEGAGQRLLVVQSPRALRGGLSFIF
jgi:Carboxypeptidase regulatory-like domain